MTLRQQTSTSGTEVERGVTPEFLAQLKTLFGDRCSMSQAVRDLHGSDESAYPTAAPDAVVHAHSTEEVAQLAALCYAHHVPLIPYGAGSSLEGHLLAVRGGVTVNVSDMSEIMSVSNSDFTATVQAGVTRNALNAYVRDQGLFFPVDPGADASFGGMTATRASGTNAVKYGTMRENVVKLKVVTADGRILETASRAKKSSTGYDLTRLFVGSEGTLGIITEVTVRLYPLPETISAAVCSFPTLTEAVTCVVELMQCGIDIARVEFLDVNAVKAVNAYSKLNLAELPLLLFEFHGSPASVDEQIAMVQELAHANGGTDFEWAKQAEDRTRLWTARHNAYYASLQLRPGCKASTTDVCVPISNLAQCVIETADDLSSASFPYTILGHVGDGNFHVAMLIDPNSTAEWEESEAINHRLVARALALEGSCSGEHGVGLHKMQFMEAEHGADALALMRSIKQALDPHNIMNPGKLLPEAIH